MNYSSNKNALPDEMTAEEYLRLFGQETQSEQIVINAEDFEAWKKREKAKEHKDWEAFLAEVLRYAEIPPHEPQFKFSPDRGWKSDFGWPEHKFIVEVEGGVWTQGRHVRPQGFLDDMDKYNEMTLLGFRLVRVTGEMIEDGRAIELIKRGLGLT